MRISPKIAENIFLKPPLKQEGDVFYFNEPPKDIIPTEEKFLTKKTWTPWRWRNFHFYEREFSKVPPGSVVIDLGAGPQYFKELMERFQLCAVDFFPYAGIDVVCNLNAPLPFKDNSIDAIMLSNVLEHMRHPELLLSECSRILKKGGRLIHTTPFMMRVHQRPYDYFRYTDIAHRELLIDTGFESVEVMSLSSPFETYESHQQSFFTAAFNSRYSTHPKGQWIALRLVKIHRLIETAISKIFGRLYAGRVPDMSYAQGYGVVAKK